MIIKNKTLIAKYSIRTHLRRNVKNPLKIQHLEINPTIIFLSVLSALSLGMRARAHTHTHTHTQYIIIHR